MAYDTFLSYLTAVGHQGLLMSTHPNASIHGLVAFRKNLTAPQGISQAETGNETKSLAQMFGDFTPDS